MTTPNPTPTETPLPPAQVAPPATAPTLWWQQAAQIRDSVIAIGAGAYLAGHICLSVQAQQLNAGPVTFPQTQIVAAGIIPALATAITIILIVLGNSAANILERWVASDQRLLKRDSWRKWNRSWALNLSIAISMTVTALIAKYLKPPFLSDANYSFIFLSSGFITGIALTALVKKIWQVVPAKKLGFFLPQFYLAMIPLIALFATVVTYCSTVLPQMPQEFGGLRPRFATIDLNAADLSATTKKVLLTQPATKEGVVTSIPLDVVFSADNCIVVRPHASKDGTTYRIGMDAVKSVAWKGYVILPKATKR